MLCEEGYPALKSKHSVIKGNFLFDRSYYCMLLGIKIFCNSFVSYFIFHGRVFFYLQVIDQGGQKTNFEDVSQVQKFEISDTEYAKRSGVCSVFSLFGVGRTSCALDYLLKIVTMCSKSSKYKFFIKLFNNLMECRLNTS